MKLSTGKESETSDSIVTSLKERGDKILLKDDPCVNIKNFLKKMIVRQCCCGRVTCRNTVVAVLINTGNRIIRSVDESFITKKL